MSVPGYVANTFSAGQQPTTSVWNELWTNDAAFNAFLSATNNVITANMLATNAISLAYAQITSNLTTTSTSYVQATGLSSTVTIPAGGRQTKITAFFPSTWNSGGNSSQFISIWDGVVGSGTQLAQIQQDQVGTNFQTGAMCVAVVSPSAGSKTYNVGIRTLAGTATFVAVSTSPAFILVEAI